MRNARNLVKEAILQLFDLQPDVVDPGLLHQHIHTNPVPTVARIPTLLLSTAGGVEEGQVCSQDRQWEQGFWWLGDKLLLPYVSRVPLTSPHWCLEHQRRIPGCRDPTSSTSLAELLCHLCITCCRFCLASKAKRYFFLRHITCQELFGAGGMRHL